MTRTQAGIAAAATLLLVVPGAAQAASPQKNSGYSGTTSQGEALSLVTSASGKRVIDLATSLTYRCTGEHDGQSGSFVLDTIKVKSGRFSARQDLHGTSDESVVQGGSGTATGTFKRRGRRATGLIRSQITLNTGETCDSGKVTFTVTLT
ncbi:MAG TPA: hypothetical protein VF517_10430 [Thermoleophilaceae bacterium]|jgi:hypothetical protein